MIVSQLRVSPLGFSLLVLFSLNILHWFSYLRRLLLLARKQAFFSILLLNGALSYDWTLRDLRECVLERLWSFVRFVIFFERVVDQYMLECSWRVDLFNVFNDWLIYFVPDHGTWNIYHLFNFASVLFRFIHVLLSKWFRGGIVDVRLFKYVVDPFENWRQS